MLEEGSENYEQEDVGGKDSGSGSKYSLRTPELCYQYPLERESVMPQIAGDVFPEEVVCQENKGENRKVSRCSSSRFENHKGSCNSDAHLEGVDPAPVAGDLCVFEYQKTESQKGDCNQDDIHNGRSGEIAFSVFSCRIQQECEQQQE